MSLAVNINRIVNATNQVITPQNTNVNLVANVLSDSPLLPNDQNRVKTFLNVQDIQNYFGILSDEAKYATVYFKGYKNATLLPPALIFSKYVLADSPAFAVSPTINNAYEVSAIYAAIKALTKPTPAVTRFVITIGTVQYTLTSNDLDFTVTTVKDFSTMVAALSSALNTALSGTSATLIPGTNNIVITAPTGTIGAITFPTGPVADILQLSQAFGGVISQGVLKQSPAVNMDTIVNLNNAWFIVTYLKRLYATATTGGDVPVPAIPATGYPISVGVAQWLSTQTAGNFAFVPFETLAVDPVSGNIPVVSTGYTNQMQDSTLARVFVLNNLGAYDTTLNKVVFTAPIHIEGGTLPTINIITGTDVGVYSAFISGACASVNFGLTRISLAGKSQDGLLPNVNVTTNYDILITNGYNVYGIFNANIQTFNLSEVGSVGGSYSTLGQFLSATWLVLQDQIAIASLIGATPFLDYTADTVSQVSAVLGNLIDTCKRNKIIQVGNTFSQDELAQVIQITGNPNSGLQLTQFGYILYFPPITAQTRSNQAPLPIYLFYSNGGEVIKVQINNIFVS